MTGWQLTAKTIYCDAVDDDVTIIVYKDGSAKCTGYKKYVENPHRETAKTLQKKAKRLKRHLGCEGPLDHRVTEYRDKIVAEDAAAQETG